MKQDYITTNIRIPRAWHKDFKRQAMEGDKSLGELIREILAQQRARHSLTNQGKKSTSYKDDPFWKLPTYATDLGDPYLSSQVDEIVYSL